jgi:hypothetical protein
VIDINSPGIPLRLESSVLIPLARPGVPDLERLQDRSRDPIVIDEISFTLSNVTAIGGGGGVDYVSNVAIEHGAFVYVKLALDGRINLTEKFVPVWNLGPLLSQGIDLSAYVGAGIGSAGNQYRFSHYRWLLPVPLIVPPGSVLVPTFEIEDNGPLGAGAVTRPYLGYPNGGITADVAFGGRRIPGLKIPSRVDIPFATAFLPSETINTTGVSVRQSGDKDLYNPFHVPMHVQRFIGRYRYMPDAFSPYQNQIITDTWGGAFGPGPTGGVTSNIAEVKLTDSRGYTGIRDFTPWPDVFDANYRSWTFGAELPPKEWAFFAVRNIGYSSGTYRLRPMISMIGHRKEAV